MPHLKTHWKSPHYKQPDFTLIDKPVMLWCQCGGGIVMVGLTGGNEYACVEARMTTRWAYWGCCRVAKGVPWIV